MCVTGGASLPGMFWLRFSAQLRLHWVHLVRVNGVFPRGQLTCPQAEAQSG